MTFLRLSRWHAIAAAAALILLLVMALDWYTTEEGEEARRTEQITGEPSPGIQGEVDREVSESSSILAEQNEDNAFQADEALDRIVLVLLLVTIALALAVAVARASGRVVRGGVAPSALVSGAAALTAVLIAVRIVDQGAIEAGGEVEVGAPMALVALGVMAFAAARAARQERADRDAGADRGADADDAAASGRPRAAAG
jgi:hypothetical protein